MASKSLDLPIADKTGLCYLKQVVVGMLKMTEFLVLVRNLVLAAIMAWFGLEFAPAEPDKSQPASVFSGLARG